MKRQWLAALVALALFQTSIPAEPRRAGLAKEQRALHALNRLTFGPRQGDLEAVERMGVDKWINQQLHPESIQENRILAEKLQSLPSLRMSQKELFARYPSPQRIVAIATGRVEMPDDPQLRAMYQRLAERYRDRIATKRNQAGTEAPDPKEQDDQRALRRKFVNAPPEERRGMLQNLAPGRAIQSELWEGKIYRALYSNRQLEEVLTDFWFNHFNVDMNKGAVRFLVTTYERDAIRPHVLGKFRDLLGATAQHPAMLFYLDNAQSVSPDSMAGRRSAMTQRKRGLNENYARELMELHTLGVDGGYTQEDIINVARCFTGWTIDQPRLGGQFVFNPRMHDPGEKKVLGVKIPAGGGMEDGEKVLDIVARHPSTARFISTKLAQRFVSDQPPASLVSAMAATFQKTDGDIRAVLKTMFKSKEFWAEQNYKAKIKSPLEMVVSAVRATDAEVTFAAPLAQQIATLGQPLYQKQEPTGYKTTGAEWVNSAALLGRMNFALALTGNKLPGVRVNPDRLDGDARSIARELLFAEPTAQTQQAIEKGLAEKKDAAMLAALVIGAPEFQRR